MAISGRRVMVIKMRTWFQVADAFLQSFGQINSLLIKIQNKIRYPNKIQSKNRHPTVVVIQLISWGSAQLLGPSNVNQKY